MLNIGDTIKIEDVIFKVVPLEYPICPKCHVCADLLEDSLTFCQESCKKLIPKNCGLRYIRA